MEDKENININFSGNKYLWIIGAVILLVAIWFGSKAIMTSFEGYKVTLIDAPKEVSVGNVATFTWRVDGPPTTINTTSVYFGTASNPGELEKNVKPADTQYTDFVKDFADGKYDVPLQFIGNVRVDKVGKYYFRVHAEAKSKHYWSEEYTFDVKPSDYKISVVAQPKDVAAGTMATFTWRIEGPPTTINQTAVYLGTISNPGSLGKEIKPTDTKYEEASKDFLNGKYNIPLQFVGNHKIKAAETYFFRIHALIDGKNYWTDESSFEVKEAK